MGEWLVLKPEEAKNLVLNPAARLTTNYSARAGSTVNRATTNARYGAYAYRITTNADEEGIDFTVQAPDAAGCYLTFIFNKYSGDSLNIQATLNGGTNWYSCTPLLEIEPDVWIYKAEILLGTGTTLSITQDGSGDGVWEIDGICLVESDHWTSYVDGEQEDCVWLGNPDVSASFRPATTKAGGQVLDLKDDYKFRVASVIGAGAAPIELSAQEYGQLPGGIVDNVEMSQREFALTGAIVADAGDADSTIYSCRHELRSLFRHDSVPLKNDLPQPNIIWFTGAAITKQISVFYASGLEGQWNSTTTSQKAHEEASVHFIAPDPNWYELAETYGSTSKSASFVPHYFAFREKDTGVWEDHVSSNPTTGGTVYCFLHASDGSIYLGGDWSGFNGGTPAGANMVVRYNPYTDTWSVLVGPSDVGAEVLAMAEGPDGKIYLVGGFTAVNGDGTLDYVMGYDPSTDTWFSLDDPDTGGTFVDSVQDCAFDSQGNFWIVGNFITISGVANASYVAYWDGTAWNAAGAPSTSANDLYTIAIDSLDRVWVGGDFTGQNAWAGINYAAMWDGSTWTGFLTTITASILAMAIGPADEVYMAGAFTNLDGVTEADYAAMWNGQAVVALGTGLDALAADVEVAPDGVVYFAGGFTGTGDGLVLTTNGFLGWNGSTWFHSDIEQDAIVRAIGFGPADPIIKSNYNIYIGLSDWDTNGRIGADNTINNPGNVVTHPMIVADVSGGTGTRLIAIRNERTGDTLWLNYKIQAGEKLTIDTRPGKASVVSSFLGSVPDAVLNNSDLGSFSLLPGDNLITGFCTWTTEPAFTFSYYLKAAFDGADA